MKKHIISIFALGAIICACSNTKGELSWQQQVNAELSQGNFSKAETILDSLIAIPVDDFSKSYQYVFKKDSLYKVRKEFRRTKEEVVEYIKRYYPEDFAQKIKQWEQNGVLEYRVIDGDTLYFRNAAPNVFRVDMDAAKLVNVGNDGGRPLDSVLNVNLPEILKSKSGELTMPKTMKVKFTIKVQADAVADGERLRAWIPYPRTDTPRQTGAELLYSSDSAIVSHDSESPHRSVYMEKKAVAGEPTIFEVVYKYTSYGQKFDMGSASIAPYDTTGFEYKTYTAARTPHIELTNTIAELSKQIVGDQQNPYLKVKKIFDYVSANYPWASALNYSIISDIPQYVLDNGKGDCGQVALLFISLARASGVPARWQSGLMVHPKSFNMHDWAEVYYQGIGWVPVDVSFGRNKALTFPQGASFFDSGIDSYRLVANSDYSGEFYPAKKYPRSETLDFQAGELESDSSNLYYDKWTWSAEVEYLD